MKCLILAAGRGSRLSGKGEPKPLIHLLGLPLIERVIAGAIKAGIGEFVVATGYREDELRAFLKELSKKRGVAIECVSNPDWQRGNATSVLAAKERLKDEERFLLVMADHLFDQQILKELEQYPLEGGSVCLATDYNTKNPFVDPADVTKVLTADGRIKAIGKGLGEYNGFDTGLFLCTPSIFEAVEESIEKEGDATLSGAIRVLAEKGRAFAMDIKGRFWIDVDDEGAFRKAEEHLLSSLKKPTDGPVARLINRHFSVAITRHLVETSLTPNQISIMCFAMSVVASLIIALPSYLALFVGAMVAQAASIVDGCDGEVARLKFMESDYGGWFDAVLDRYSDAFLLAALTWHAYAEDGSALTLLTGFLAITGSFMTSYTADKYDSLMKARLLKGGALRIGRDVRVFILFLGAILNMVFPALLLIAVVMNLETVRRLIICRR